MKKLETYMVEEEINIPIMEQKFYKFENVEDLESESFHGGVGVPYLFRFKTEYGDVYGYTNPAWASENGYFKVMFNYDDDTESGYCADMRIIASIRKVLEEVYNGNSNTVIWKVNIAGEREVEEIYKKYEIPRFTLI